MTITRRRLLVFPPRWGYVLGGLLKTRQTTAYHVGDDGDYEAGLPASYTVLTAGQHNLTTNIDTPHYAAATLSFTAATKTIADSAAGLVTILTGDTIRVRGSASNDGVYTVATGGVAGAIVTTEALAGELAGAYITLCKRSAPSNNAVIDNVTGLMWKRYTTGGPVERVGPLSNGTLNWYDTLTCFTLHPAAADLQMMVTGIKVVGGAAELPAYFVGMIIDSSGFANAVNNLPGYRVTAVAVNGTDLDITLWTGRNTLIAEAAAGARDIRVICQSIYAYAAAANAASFGGYTDWRNPDVTESWSLATAEAPLGVPNAVIFPTWPQDATWTSTVRTDDTTQALYVFWPRPTVANIAKTNPTWCELVRG